MAQSGTLFLRVPSPPPQYLVVAVYPLIDKMPHHRQVLSFSIRGRAIHRSLLTGRQVYTLRVPLTPADSLVAGQIVSVSLDVDRVVPPTAMDRRELGLIVSKVGFE